MASLFDLAKEQQRIFKQEMLKGRKPYTRKQETPANSNDFIFDRKTLTIRRKEIKQLELL